MSQSATLHTHIALVPVATVDSQVGQALTYAATLTPQVLGVHVRSHPRGRAEAIEDEWTRSGATLPLLVLEPPHGDTAGAFRRAVELLKRTELVDQITIVIPSYPPDDRHQQLQVAAWCAELQGQRGIAIRQTPARS